MIPGSAKEAALDEPLRTGSPSVLYRYSFAVLVPIAMMCAAFGIWLKFPHNPVVFALTAIIIVSWHAGFGPGLLSVAVTTAVIRVLFFPDAALAPGLAESLRVVVFLGMAVLISFLSTARRNAEAALREANAELDQRVRQKTAELQALNRVLQAAVEERIEVQTKLERSHQLKDDFLALVGHELRNPLSVISNGLDLLKLNPPPERRAGIEKMMARQAKQLMRIVDDLADVERISRGKFQLRMELLSVREALELAGAAAQPMIQEKSHALLVRPPEPDLYIEADRARLEQALMNLLTNASRYTPPGGRIELSARLANGDCLISCRDNGVGLSPDVLESIFEPFVQCRSEEHRDTPGLGLGLNLVKRLAELHGGDVKAESAGPGAGSEFILRLPALASQPPSREPASLAGSAREAGV